MKSVCLNWERKQKKKQLASCLHGPIFFLTADNRSWSRLEVKELVYDLRRFVLNRRSSRCLEIVTAVLLTVQCIQKV